MGNCAHAQFAAESNCFGVYRDPSEFRADAAGCSQCRLVLDLVEAYRPGWLPGAAVTAADNHEGSNAASSLERYVYFGQESGPGVIFLHEGSAGKWNAMKMVGAFSVFREATGKHDFGTRDWEVFKTVPWESLDVVEDTSSAVAVERASTWLSQCVDNHKECRIPNPEFVPHRLLSVSGPGEPFLFEPTAPTDYVCLSYCWGQDTVGLLTTTVNNAAAHYKAVPMLDMPRTIQDAVTLCRALGFAYLWVDSLCIVQDDPDDWLQQSSQMRNIYINSHFTIAAEEPVSCKIGFLGQQHFAKPEWQRTVTVDVPPEAGGPAERVLLRTMDGPQELDRLFKDLGMIGFRPRGYRANGRCSLDKRAWCLQESILPNRRLRFNGKEMTWECANRTVCECGHQLWLSEGMPYGALGNRMKNGYENVYWTKAENDWAELVEEYSDRSLTQVTDKLSAISGLAKVLLDRSRKPDDESASNESASVRDYKAGLLMKKFIAMLAWRVVKFPQAAAPAGEPASSKSYRAPSWSWASVDGSVRYQDRIVVDRWKYKPDRRLDCKVDGVFCEPALASDPTGPVKSAYAILTGPLVEVELAVLDKELSAAYKPPDYDPRTGDAASPHKSFIRRATNLCTVQVSLDRPREPTIRAGDPEAGDWLWVTTDWKRRAYKGKNDFFGMLEGGAKASASSNSRVYCLELFTWIAYTGRYDPDTDKPQIMPPETWFLVLQKLPGDEAVFQRIGVGCWCASRGDIDECLLFDESESATVKII